MEMSPKWGFVRYSSHLGTNMCMHTKHSYVRVSQGIAVIVHDGDGQKGNFFLYSLCLFLDLWNVSHLQIKSYLLKPHEITQSTHLSAIHRIQSIYIHTPCCMTSCLIKETCLIPSLFMYPLSYPWDALFFGAITGHNLDRALQLQCPADFVSTLIKHTCLCCNSEPRDEFV